MKVRWTTDSIRVRITPSELSTIRQGSGEFIADSLIVNGLSFWSVTVLSHTGRTTLDFERDNATVLILLSPQDTDELCRPDTEGVYLQDAATDIRYYIEKDFPCAHPRAIEALEPATDTFEPPAGFLERKMD